MKAENKSEQKEKRNSNGSRNSAAKEWLTNLKADQVINNAQRILTTAVDVLEEEIAAGILAAKKIEKKVIDVDEIRKDPEELMSRIRRDTHDAVDIFMDALTVLTNHLGNLSDLVIKTREAAPVSKRTPINIPVLSNERPALAGKELTIPLMITNDNATQQIAVEIVKADLSGRNAGKISARCIKILPKSFLLAANEQKEVLIKILVPLTCKSGIYSGLFHDMYDPELRTVVSVTVE